MPINVAIIANSFIFLIVYIIGVGITSIVAKIFGKSFLDMKLSKKKKSYWSELNLKKQPIESCGVVLSSRASFEMIAKAARANAEIIIAVSAPSSLAIEAADKWNITLCGFVRPDRAKIYSDGSRIGGDD